MAKKVPGVQKQVGVRFSDETYAAVEKHLARMRATCAPGVEIKLADAVRNLIMLGLEAAK